MLFKFSSNTHVPCGIHTFYTCLCYKSSYPTGWAIADKLYKYLIRKYNLDKTHMRVSPIDDGSCFFRAQILHDRHFRDLFIIEKISPK